MDLKNFSELLKICQKIICFPPFHSYSFLSHLDWSPALVAVKMGLPTSSRQVIDTFACAQRRLREKVLLSTAVSEEGLEEPDPDLSELHARRDRKNRKNKFSHWKYQ